MAEQQKTVLPELSIECTLKAKDLYRIMPPDNKMRRRIVDASTVLGKAATALVEADTTVPATKMVPCRNIDWPAQPQVEVLDHLDEILTKANGN